MNEDTILKRFLFENVDSVAREMAKLTDNNAHSEALMKLAQFLNDKAASKQLTDIDKKHNQQGHLSMDLKTKRDKIYKSLIAKAKKELSPSDYKKIYSAL